MTENKQPESDDAILKEVERNMGGYLPSRANKIKEIIKTEFAKAIRLTREDERQKCEKEIYNHYFGKMKYPIIIEKETFDKLMNKEAELQAQKKEFEWKIKEFRERALCDKRDCKVCNKARKLLNEIFGEKPEVEK